MGLGRARKEASVRGEGTGDFDPTSSILWPPNRPFPSQPLERAEVTPLSPIQKKKKIFFPVISEGSRNPPSESSGAQNIKGR